MVLGVSFRPQGDRCQKRLNRIVWRQVTRLSHPRRNSLMAFNDARDGRFFRLCG
jgi:hypothetical protein